MNDRIEIYNDYCKRLKEWNYYKEKFKNVPNGFKFFECGSMFSYKFSWYKDFNNIINGFLCTATLEFRPSRFRNKNAYLCLLLDVYRDTSDNKKNKNKINSILYEIFLEEIDTISVLYEDIDMDLIKIWCNKIDTDYIRDLFNQDPSGLNIFIDK